MAKKTSTKKSAKATKVKGVKKVRTKEEKAARNLRRKARRESRKETAKLKATIEAKNPSNVISVEKPSIFPWKEVETSDGLPFSKSIDNPDSLLSQLARERADAEAAKAKAAADGKKMRTTPVYTPVAKECILSINI
jgi:hypothetical protein